MTALELEDYTFAIIQQVCQIGVIDITGSVYPKGFRPFNADTEDIVVSFLNGNEKQVQEGNIIINAYVKDLIATDGLYYMNRERCKDLSNQFKGIDQYLSAKGDVYYELDDAILTLEVPQVHQHAVSVKLKYKLLTN